MKLMAESNGRQATRLSFVRSTLISGPLLRDAPLEKTTKRGYTKRDTAQPGSHGFTSETLD